MLEDIFSITVTVIYPQSLYFNEIKLFQSNEMEFHQEINIVQEDVIIMFIKENGKFGQMCQFHTHAHTHAYNHTHTHIYTQSACIYTHKDHTKKKHTHAHKVFP